jgi:hypothetical protein
MNRFESWGNIEAFEDEIFGITGLTPAEEKLRDALSAGETCVLGDDGERPDAPVNWATPSPNLHIRAIVLRFALLRPAHADDATEFGVSIKGAIISGHLDLRDCTIHGNAIFNQCLFQDSILAARAEFKKDLNFRKSVLTDLFAGYTKIGGQLVCDGATFASHKDEALNLQDADIKGGLYFRDLKSITGRINLIFANTSSLVDDPESWDLADTLILDGFTYGRIGGSSSATDYKTRLRWLEKGDHYGDTFFPQPYTQLAKVLQEMGHERDAREIRIALADKMNRDDRSEFLIAPNGDVRRAFQSLWSDLRICILWLRHMTSRLLTAHGYKPVRAVWALLALIACTWFIAHKTWQAGDFTPNSALVLNSEDWHALDGAPHQANAWDTTLSGKDWETFQSLAYAFDVVIPIVDLGQTQAWAPSTNRGWWGKQLWWARWVFTSAGWIISALGAAAITGVIRRE